MGTELQSASVTRAAHYHDATVTVSGGKRKSHVYCRSGLEHFIDLGETAGPRITAGEGESVWNVHPVLGTRLDLKDLGYREAR
jgi:hypothetical protein